jgi:hypothetical protein
MIHHSSPHETSMQRTANPKCHSCGHPVDLMRDDVLVESADITRNDRDGEMVWHQVCFDDFLDQGEET